MKIRKATEQDLPRMMEIYAFAREYMKEHGNPNQWGPTNWPPETLIHDDKLVMQGLLKKLGFVHCGTIYVEEDNYPRLAYEKF